MIIIEVKHKEYLLKSQKVSRTLWVITCILSAFSSKNCNRVTSDHWTNYQCSKIFMYCSVE